MPDIVAVTFFLMIFCLCARKQTNTEQMSEVFVNLFLIPARGSTVYVIKTDAPQSKAQMQMLVLF